VVVAALVLLVPVQVVLYVVHDLNSNITRLDGLLPPENGRPSRASGSAAQAVNVLVLGADEGTSRASAAAPAAATAAASTAGAASDTLMLLHIDADRHGASIISIPAESWVEVPGHGRAVIGQAGSWGGPALAVSTLERLSRVRVDHVAIVGWDGYEAMIDALGGVDVTVPKAAYDSERRTFWTPGVHHLNGADAVRYARGGSDRAGGDLDSVTRRQALLRALSDRATAATSSPTAVYRLLEGLTHHLTVDSSWGATDMAKLALSLRGMGASDVSYLTIPVSGTGVVGGRNVVFIDRRAGGSLWAAVRADRIGD
jgi:LCP family protein required for cell wall assembly